MKTIKRNAKGNFELEGVEFNGQVFPNGFFTGVCLTQGWNHVQVAAKAISKDELDDVNFMAHVLVCKGVTAEMDRKAMKKVHDALCGPDQFGPGFDWK